MKRIISLMLVCLIITLMLVSCNDPVGEFKPAESAETSARFCELGRETISPAGGLAIEQAVYYVDIYTDIVYVYVIDRNGNATTGGFTVLYNAAGAPMTLEEFLN